MNAYVTIFTKDKLHNISNTLKDVLDTCKFIKKTKSKYDVVCMITNDVDEETRKELQDEFTGIVNINYLDYPTKLKNGNLIQSYEISKVYTVWQCLHIGNYNKVAFIPPGVFLEDNTDHIFDFKLPSGVFNKSNITGILLCILPSSEKLLSQYKEFMKLMTPYEVFIDNSYAQQSIMHFFRDECEKEWNSIVSENSDNSNKQSGFGSKKFKKFREVKLIKGGSENESVYISGNYIDWK